MWGLCHLGPCSSVPGSARRYTAHPLGRGGGLRPPFLACEAAPVWGGGGFGLGWVCVHHQPRRILKRPPRGKVKYTRRDHLVRMVFGALTPPPEPKHDGNLRPRARAASPARAQGHSRKGGITTQAVQKATVGEKFFLTRDRRSTKCPPRVHKAGQGSGKGPTVGE